MENRMITEMLADHQVKISRLIDDLDDDHSKIVLLKKHLAIHHKMIDELMQSLMLNVLMTSEEENPYQPSIWNKKLKVLREVVQYHLKEEKHDLFPRAEKYIPKDKLKDLGTQFSQEEDTTIKK